MANKGKEEEASFDIDSLNIEDMPLREVKKNNTKDKEEETSVIKVSSDDEPIINCLRNERVIVRHIPKQSGMVTNPKHILYGNMAETAVKIFVVPRLSSGAYVNVLTNDEMRFLEQYLGLEPNSMSIYRKKDNYWDDNNENSVARVRLTKQDNYLDLSDPEDYIRYKILLANKDYIAPSIEALQDYPKASYLFVMISENEENEVAQKNMSATMRCYKEYGKIEDDIETLRVIVETIDGRPTSPNTKLSSLLTKVNDLIQSDSKLFLKVITDKMLNTKVLIKKCIEQGLIAKRGNFYYLYDSMTNLSEPLCELNEEPTLNIASKYLNAPKHLEIKMMLEAKLK